MSDEIDAFGCLGMLVGLALLVVLLGAGIALVVYACKFAWWMVAGAWGAWS